MGDMVGNPVFWRSPLPFPITSPHPGTIGIYTGSLLDHICSGGKTSWKGKMGPQVCSVRIRCLMNGQSRRPPWRKKVIQITNFYFFSTQHCWKGVSLFSTYKDRFSEMRSLVPVLWSNCKGGVEVENDGFKSTNSNWLCLGQSFGTAYGRHIEFLEQTSLHPSATLGRP